MDFNAHIDDDIRTKEFDQFQNVGSLLPLEEGHAPKCVNFVIRKVEALQKNYGMEVILVIDGAPLPCKERTDRSRRANRIRAFEEALAFERRGDSIKARRLFGQACSVSYEIRYDLIQKCKALGISFIVAPYEADAQMASLALKGIVDIVVTEDSDMLVYGCPRVLFKIDFDSGKGDEIQLLKDIGRCRELDFKHWSHNMFVYMCILSGCDYCEGVPGIGIKTAHKVVRLHRNPKAIFKVLKASAKMPPHFEEDFMNAFRTFRHQRVFCLDKKRMESLHNIDISHLNAGENAHNAWPFLGRWVNDAVVEEIAFGNLHPKHHVAWEAAFQNSSLQNIGHVSDKMRKDDESRQSTKNIPNIEEKKELKSSIFGFQFASKSLESKEVPSCIDPRLVRDEVDRQQKIPVRSEDYVSRLVSKDFRTINCQPRRRNVSEAIRHLHATLSVPNKTTQDPYNSSSVLPREKSITKSDNLVENTKDEPSLNERILPNIEDPEIRIISKMEKELSNHEPSKMKEMNDMSISLYETIGDDCHPENVACDLTFTDVDRLLVSSEKLDFNNALSMNTSISVTEYNVVHKDDELLFNDRENLNENVRHLTIDSNKFHGYKYFQEYTSNETVDYSHNSLSSPHNAYNHSSDHEEDQCFDEIEITDTKGQNCDHSMTMISPILTNTRPREETYGGYEYQSRELYASFDGSFYECNYGQNESDNDEEVKLESITNNSESGCFLKDIGHFMNL